MLLSAQYAVCLSLLRYEHNCTIKMIKICTRETQMLLPLKQGNATIAPTMVSTLEELKMPRLLIANDCPEQVLGYNSEFSNGLGIWAQRLLWHIEENDIIVLPTAPEAGYVAYIAGLLGINPESLSVIVAPKGSAGNLSADRLLNQELYQAISLALAGRSIKTIVSLTPDTAVTALARSLGVQSAVPGSGFASQGGGVLVNSKAIFRAIAAGIHVPIPAGVVTRDPFEAQTAIKDMLLNQQVAVIVKKDFGQGCRGNEILCAVDGLKANGGRRSMVLANPEAINTYIAQNWDWLSNEGQHHVIIEQYFPDSMAIFAEFELGAEGVQFAGIGEMLAAPIADGQVIPPVGLSPISVAEIIDQGHRLSVALHNMGYRGILSADAIVTPEGQVMFSEYNGRITGSTHIYSTVGKRLVGEQWMKKRVLLERRGWTAPSFQAAVDNLYHSGLTYDHEQKTGVVLTGTFIPARQVISYTIVAEDLPAAIKMEKQLHAVSPRAVEALA